MCQTREIDVKGASNDARVFSLLTVQTDEVPAIESQEDSTLGASKCEDRLI